MCKLPSPPPHRATHTLCPQKKLLPVAIPVANTPCSMLPGNGSRGWTLACWERGEKRGGRLSEPPQGGRACSELREQHRGWQGWGCRDTAEGLLTHLVAACEEVGAAIWREELLWRLSNREGANPGKR